MAPTAPLPLDLPQASHHGKAPKNAPVWLSVRVSPRKGSSGKDSYHPSQTLVSIRKTFPALAVSPPVAPERPKNAPRNAPVVDASIAGAGGVSFP